jgi:hypothetical protein
MAQFLEIEPLGAILTAFAVAVVKINIIELEKIVLFFLRNNTIPC